MNDTPTEREAMNWWALLRRRKVAQWTVAYAAGAWAILQVLGFAADTYTWPGIVAQLAMLGLALGLPVVVTLAWFHGERSQQRVSGRELAILTFLLLLGGGLLWWYADRPATTAQQAASASPGEVGAAPDQKSIAVLPFADMSPDKDQEYMSDGIAEELLNLLAKVPDLKVIARTSSFAFKGQNVEIAEWSSQDSVDSSYLTPMSGGKQDVHQIERRQSPGDLQVHRGASRSAQRGDDVSSA